MKWKTAISTHKDGELVIRGKKLVELIETSSFVEVVFLLLRGTPSSEKETAMLNAMLVSCIEHGIETPSAFVARTAASVGNQLHVALATGILATGDWHGGAIEKAAQIFASDANPKEVVKETLLKGGKLAGFGHKIYKDADPRTEALFAKAKRIGLHRAYVARALAYERELETQTGKKLPLNIDGAVAALLLELGFDWRLGKAFFVLARLPGLIAHAHEEAVNEKPYRRLDEEDVEYVGA